MTNSDRKRSLTNSFSNINDATPPYKKQRLDNKTPSPNASKMCYNGSKCHRKNCQYQHPSKTQRFDIPCKFQPNCNNPRCPYKHKNNRNKPRNSQLQHAPYNNTNNGNTTKTCNRCDRIGHNIMKCRARSTNDGKSLEQPTQCQKCGWYNHIASKCRTDDNKKNPSFKPQTTTQNAQKSQFRNYNPINNPQRDQRELWRSQQQRNTNNNNHNKNQHGNYTMDTHSNQQHDTTQQQMDSMNNGTQQQMDNMMAMMKEMQKSNKTLQQNVNTLSQRLNNSSPRQQRTVQRTNQQSQSRW